jgi:hypothetical protein
VVLRLGIEMYMQGHHFRRKVDLIEFGFNGGIGIGIFLVNLFDLFIDVDSGKQLYSWFKLHFTAILIDNPHLGYQLIHLLETCF